jgi:hypothetical protein
MARWSTFSVRKRSGSSSDGGRVEMTLITDSNWDVNYFISQGSDLRLGNCDYNGTRVIYAASVPFIYVNYSAGFFFTDRVESNSGIADVRNIADGFDIRASYDLYGGSYLYEHIWRFYSDGQFGSTIIVHGPGVDHNDNHTYHVPFRYDLDVSGASGDSFQRRFLPFAPWANVAQEGRVLSFFPPTLFNWRLLDTATGKRAMIRTRRATTGRSGRCSTPRWRRGPAGAGRSRLLLVLRAVCPRFTTTTRVCRTPM